MSNCEQHSVLAPYHRINLDVVEVRVGENREEAWRRYLAEHPEKITIDIKILHYPNPNRCKHNDPCTKTSL